MKKEYIKPEVEVIEMTICSMLANSVVESEDNLTPDAREDYDYDRGNNHPGGNIWDSNW